MQKDLPLISLRVYLIRSKKVPGSKIPKIELEEMGPWMDLKFGRWKEANDVGIEETKGDRSNIS